MNLLIPSIPKTLQITFFYMYFIDPYFIENLTFRALLFISYPIYYLNFKAS